MMNVEILQQTPARRRPKAARRRRTITVGAPPPGCKDRRAAAGKSASARITGWLAYYLDVRSLLFSSRILCVPVVYVSM
jgi:hypothetical protein